MRESGVQGLCGRHLLRNTVRFNITTFSFFLSNPKDSTAPSIDMGVVRSLDMESMDLFSFP